MEPATKVMCFGFSVLQGWLCVLHAILKSTFGYEDSRKEGVVEHLGGDRWGIQYMIYFVSASRKYGGL